MKTLPLEKIISSVVADNAAQVFFEPLRKDTRQKTIKKCPETKPQTQIGAEIFQKHSHDPAAEQKAQSSW